MTSKHVYRALAALALPMVMSTRAAGQDGWDATEAAPTEEAVSNPAPNFPTGDWWGARTKLADHGILVGGYIQVDTSRNTTGGLRHDKTEMRYLLDLNVTVDTMGAFKFPGGALFMDVQNHDGPNASADLVGDVQGFDNMDGAHYAQIYQSWYQQHLAGDMVRVKVGKIDCNNDFSSIDHAKDFFHSADAYSISIFPMVTYPDPAPGGEIFFSPDAHFYVGAGAFYSNQHNTFLNISGHPESIERASGGMFLIGETGCRWTLGKDALAGHAAIGGWEHTGHFANLTERETSGTGGAYAFIDQSIYHSQSADGVTRDIGVFLNSGHAERSVSQVASHIGGGIMGAGLIPGRPADLVGTSVNWVRLGEIPGKVHNSECDMEAFYKCQVTPWFVLKPDLQYVRHPGGLDVNDALVFTLRVEVDF